MIYSLNEIDVMCKRAARGAGFEWGYAEEIGKAVRWLATHRLPGTKLFAAYLSDRHAGTEKFCGPPPESGDLVEPENNAVLCPVLTGASLCDRADNILTGRLRIKSLGYPLLILPYLARLAGNSNQGLEFCFGESRILFSGDRLSHKGEFNPGCKKSEIKVSWQPPETLHGDRMAVTGQDVDAADWQILNTYAKRTYVPATEESRLGAGPSE